MVVHQRITKVEQDTAVALGLFDGVHRGHCTVIKKAVEERKKGLLPVALTFQITDIIPKRKKGFQRLISDSQKVERLAACGIEMVQMPRFQTIMLMTAEEFVREILHVRLQAKAVVVGEDYRFGRGGEGDTAMLQALCAEYGIRVVIVSQLLDHGEPISSTRIRKALAEGDIPEANRLLGYDFGFDFTVVYGKQIGRTIGIPTINQEFPLDFILPKFGVYESYVVLEGKSRPSITNIGVKPTIDGERFPLAETHIIGVDDDLYGENIPVHLVRFLRPERKFDTIEELTAAIRENIDQVLANQKHTR